MKILPGKEENKLEPGFWPWPDPQPERPGDIPGALMPQRGEKGDPGAAASVTIGTVTTLEPGEEATVTNSGTDFDAVLNFAIPKGKDGENGEVRSYPVGTAPIGEIYENHRDGAGALFDVANSYFDVAYDPDDELLYQSERGWGYETTTDDAGKKAIVCSEFAEACIGGIYYSRNRYENTNKRIERESWGWCSDGSGTYAAYANPDGRTEEEMAEKIERAKSLNYIDYMIASRLAEYFDNHKQLYAYYDGHEDSIQPGDMLFYITEGSTKWRSITHVGFCAYNDGKYYGLMQSTDNRTRMVDGKEPGVVLSHETFSQKTPAYFVKSPIEADYKNMLLYNVSGNWSGAKTDASEKWGAVYDTIRVCFPIENLTEKIGRGFYTVEFDLNSDCDFAYLYVYFGGSNNSNLREEVGRCTYCAGRNKIVFYAQMPFDSLQIRISGGSHFECTNVKIYKGYHA